MEQQAPDTQPPCCVIRPGNRPSVSQATEGAASNQAPRPSDARLSAREIMLLLPNLGKLFWRLARDRRVPFGAKLLVIATGVYLAIPIDVIPDWIPGLGYLDDALLVGFVLHRLLRTVPREILDEHWDGRIPIPDLAQKLPFRRKQKGAPSEKGKP